MALPLVWSGFHAAVQPREALGQLSDLEQPLTIRSPLGEWAALVALGWFALAYRARNVAAWEPALLVVGGTLALLRLGNTWLFAMAMVAPLARQVHLARIPFRLLFGAALVFIFISAGLLVATRPAPTPNTAVQAALAAPSTSGNVLAARQWADTVQRGLGSGRTVLGAGDLWGQSDEYWSDFQKMSLAHVTWAELLQRYDVGMVVLDASGSQKMLAAEIRQAPNWRTVLDDGSALVAVRINP